MIDYKSYRDIVNFNQSLKALEKAYSSKENTDENLDTLIKQYKQIAEDRKNTNMPDLLKEKLVDVVRTYEGPDKAKSLEASLQ